MMRRTLITAAVFFALGGGSPSSRADEVVDRRVEANLTLLQAKARLAARQAEKLALPLEGDREIKGQKAWFDALSQGEAATAARKHADKSAETLRSRQAEVDALTETWKATARRRVNLEESKAGLLPGPGSGRRLMLWSLLAVGAGILLAWCVPNRPRPSRWQERSRAAQTIRGAWIGGLIAAFVGTAGWLGYGLRSENLPLITWSSATDSMGDRPTNETQTVTKAADELEKDIDARRLETEKRWAAGFGTTVKDWQELRGNAHETARKMLELAYLEKELLEQRDSEESAGSRDNRFLYAFLRAILYAGILLAAVLPWLVYRYDAARRRTAEFKKCPRCQQGSLSPAKGRATVLACAKCDFELARPYRKLHRLCFPTVGVVHSGKTHWMLETYHLIRQGGLPQELRLERLGSREESRFDAEIELLRQRHQGTTSTRADETAFPYPLLFHFREGEASGALLNLFDFSGEMTGFRLHESGLRRRALAMDGFVFVLDPTKKADPQREALDRFCHELREAHDISPSEPLPIPVAICLTKLDLLPSRTRLGERGLEWLAQLRNGSRDILDLNTLRARSDIARELIGEVFQEWNVLQTLRQQFGANFHLFPLSPVGIDEDDDLLLRLPNQNDLRGRAFAPFAVLEPILWLIHMHGYKVFH